MGCTEDEAEIALQEIRDYAKDPLVMVCKACLEKTLEDLMADENCHTCGGHRICLQKITCKCGRFGWNRLGVHTMYEGKTYSSVDGLEWTCHMNKPNNCKYCEASP